MKTNLKLQAPSSNIQRGTNDRPPNLSRRRAIGIWSLVFLWSLEFGVWSFFSPASFAQEAKPLKASGTYASDLGTVSEAQEDALAQARDMLENTENANTHKALEGAIKEMERSRKALAEAKHDPEKLPAALAAEQSAYQALLKIIPRETRMTRSRNRSQSGRSAGQASQEQMNQLELTPEENRYETERQASAAPNEQQREQLKIADKLKQLAQRQQDLNERLKELQTALAEAKTEREREEAQRQLKRLTEEQRQMLVDVDELKQQMEQSPNANSMSQARQQLDQVRSETQKASDQLEKQQASQALAAGSRAEQDMQKLRNDLRSQTSSQFTEQMRQMRSQARDLSRQEEEIRKGLEALNNPDHKSLDDSAPRKELAQQMEKQQSALTNLLSTMQTVTEQAESTEPLLSQQLYDTLRRASQMHTDNDLQAAEEMVSRGLVNQAGMAERAARTNIDEIRQRVERAAESVLGNEGDALRYAQKELDDLANRLEREIAAGETNNGTNGNGRAAASGRGTNALERLAQSGSEGSANENSTNNASANSQRGNNGQNGQEQSSQAQNRNGQQGQQPGQQQGGQQQGQNGQQNSSQAASGNQQNNNGQRGNRGQQQGQQAQNGQGQGEGRQQADANANDANGNGGTEGVSDVERLRQMVQRMGANNGANGGASYGPANGGVNYGPITGNDYLDWTTRMRDVEQVLDEAALRNRLATARERLASLRAEFRQSRIKPKADLVRRQILEPITEVRVQVREDLARLSNASSLVPLDHDPVPENYSELVRKYYEKLGDGR